MTTDYLIERTLALKSKIVPSILTLSRLASFYCYYLSHITFKFNFHCFVLGLTEDDRNMF